MSVTPLRPGIINSEHKQQILDHVASQYDEYAKEFGEPDALLFGFSTTGGRASAHWIMPAIDEGYMVTMLMCNIATHLMATAMRISE